jgi:2-keto-4-pentenoate hydratase
MTPAILLQHLDSATLWPADTVTQSQLDLPQAYSLALQVRAERLARGELARGYKIGFTNPAIWPRYNVSAPVWGSVYNTTLSRLDQAATGQAVLSLTGRAQPRIEPEAVFGMRATPPANATLDELLASIDWVAPGFEIVQSHAVGWKFTAPLAVADGSLHSHLVVGNTTPVSQIANNAEALNAALAHCTLSLTKNSVLVEHGQGSNVMQSPLLALAHFLRELRQCPGAPDVQAGDVITTGTWTDAWPVAPGEVWQAQFAAPLQPLTLRFE